MTQPKDVNIYIIYFWGNICKSMNTTVSLAFILNFHTLDLLQGPRNGYQQLLTVTLGRYLTIQTTLWQLIGQLTYSTYTNAYYKMLTKE